MTVTKYTYVKWQWIFYFWYKCCLSSITAKTATGLNCIYEYHDGCLLRSDKSLTFGSNWIHPRSFVESVLPTVFVLCYYVSICSEFRVMISVTISRQKDVRFVFASNCLRCLWLLAYSGVQYILCCGFILHCVPCVANFSGLSIFD